ncbi:MAG TPA: GAF domain-containing protein [Ktedonobacteraceae bacterium]|jgi:GAF domain-containing protein
MTSLIFPGVAGLLAALARSAGESDDLPKVMSQIARTARVQLDASGCLIYGLNPATRHAFPPAISFAYRHQADLVRVLCAQPRIRAVLARDTVLIEERGQAGAETFVLLKDLPGVQTIVALPLRVRRRQQKSFGLLFLLYQQSQAFGPADHELFQVFADQIAVILENVWLQERYREVARIGQDINHGQADIHSLVGNLQQHISHILDAQSALLLIVYRPQNRTMDCYHAQERHLIIDAGHEFDGACRYVIETRRLLFIPHRSKDAQGLPFHFASFKGTSAQESFIFVPLLLGNEAIGVLSIQHPEPDAYTRQDQFVLELLANHVALALYNARLYHSLNLLYETGQILTQQFEATSTPQTIVDNIKGATQADLVVLYPYDMATGAFTGSPCLAGQSLAPQAADPSSPDNVIRQMLARREPIFAEKSETLYALLLGNTAGPSSQRFCAREQICSTAAIPLRVEEKTLGVLFVNFRQPQHFDDSRRLLIEGLAHYAAIAIKNAQTFGRLNERRIQELETLQKIDSVLNTTFLEISQILAAILHLAHERVRANCSSILLYNAQREYFTTGAIHGPGADLRQARRLANRTGVSMIRWVVTHRQAVLVNNVHSELPWREIYLQANKETISELDVPLMDAGQVIGVLNFESESADAFCQEDLLFLETLAGQAVLAIKKAQAYERERRFAERFRLLYAAGQELGRITATPQIERAYATIVRLAQELSQSPVVIRRYDEESRQLQLVASSAYRNCPPSSTIDIHEQFNGRVARELRTLVIDDVGQDCPSGPADPTIRSLLITPITFKERYYGNLELTHHQSGHFQDKDQEFFEGLAQQLASTLYRLEITQERQELAQRAREAETMVSIGQAAYEITHRIGNDLGLVGSYTARVRENVLSVRVNGAFVCEHLASIDEAVRRVLDLSESLRSELSIWRDSDHFVLLPPGVLLDEALQAVPLPESIETLCEIAPDVAPVSVIHPLIIDTLSNLIINAKEAMSAGGRLMLRARNRGRSVSLEVIDTGMGIPPEHLRHIFDLFFSTKDHGSGFGLWSAQRNALKNRGRLEVESQVNNGTTFALLLPRAQEQR